ncbi:hypothetical protein PFICI_12383 [Pestalotiopsis fici W106-1]|uniref:Uncharacterized protein n=1 Tax=Pestalotiopsis fici (strain W106-1 / CGMCC3.15140) TaxID=1229662 RepID=W3WNR9_PESFW|nr:uncharacterized protein PFICI_12383 [Pestalotiopsis fici W106-1]ETS75439.1 hypothetical protein PFICI_12383 [Pestalotiopsis fici W106-1]
MTLKPSQIEDINMPGLSQSFPSLPVPDKEGVFHNDSPMKPDASRQALPAPVIRILAPTPEDEEHGSEPLAVRLATLALNSHHDEPAQDGSRSSRQP